MYLAVDGQLAGLLAVSDPIKNSTPEAVKDLKAAGIRVIMATGDGVSTAKAVARQMGINEIHGEVTPAEKLRLVRRLQTECRIVTFACEATNTSPAVAQPDFGT